MSLTCGVILAKNKNVIYSPKENCKMWKTSSVMVELRFYKSSDV